MPAHCKPQACLLRAQLHSHPAPASSPPHTWEEEDHTLCSSPAHQHTQHHCTLSFPQLHAHLHLPLHRSEDEDYILCNIDNVLTSSPYATTLGELELSLTSVEALLSALEACGVDNCRIEVEGGREVPVLDGSALGWVLEIQQSGLRPAPFEVGVQVRPSVA